MHGDKRAVGWRYRDSLLANIDKQEKTGGSMSEVYNIEREYYRIRLLDSEGICLGWHNITGVDRWRSLAMVERILHSGIYSWYRAETIEGFANYEVVRFSEEVKVSEEVVTLEK